MRTARWLWTLRGRPAAGMFFKQQRCLRVARQYGCDTFVETGTFRGDTVEAMRRRFRSVHSIELFEPLFERARNRFAGMPNVHLYHGDSALVLRQVLPRITGRALFWLDGHYSGPGTGLGASECPVLEELAAIATHERRDHCILIDDARLFGVHPDYPSIDEVTERLRAINATYDVRLEHDCVVAVPTCP